MNKKSIFLLVSVFLFLVIFSSLSFAYTVNYTGGYTSQSVYKYGSASPTTLGGGAFNFTSDIPNNSSFQSFCLETDEWLYSGVSNAQISLTAHNGGANTDSGDALSIGTAWLYSQFATGKLGTVNNAQLQFAIWALEDELNASKYNYGDGSNIYLTDVISQFQGFAAAQANSSGEYGVFVLNLTSNTGEFRQDQLVYTPTPIPGALLLLGSGLIGLVGIRRRMKR
jgi:hypothetical protein